MNLKDWLIPDWYVRKKYLNAGIDVGKFIKRYYPEQTKQERFEKLLDELVECEYEYAKRGYKTIELNTFVNLRKETIKDLMNFLGTKTENPVLYARKYKMNYPLIELMRKYGAEKKRNKIRN